MIFKHSDVTNYLSEADFLVGFWCQNISWSDDLQNKSSCKMAIHHEIAILSEYCQFGKILTIHQIVKWNSIYNSAKYPKFKIIS